MRAAILAGVFVVIASAWLAGRSAIEHTYRDAAIEVCRLVDENYYRRQVPEVRKHVQACFQSARAQGFVASKAENIKRINQRLEPIGSSHLAVYDPAENRQMWENAGLDTGLRAKFVEDKLVVFRVLPESAAARVGVKVGDALLTLDGEAGLNALFVQSASGIYHVERKGQVKRLYIVASQIGEDLSPTLKDLGGGWGLLTMRSFLAQYFETPKWTKIAERLETFRGLVIDLRENAGGSFPAMLRALSPFRCEDKNVGRIFTDLSRAGFRSETEMKDSLDSQSQLVQLHEGPSVRLRAFEKYGCFEGPVVALIDSGTSSVSEIFASAILTRQNADLLGSPSAAQVVMARWFPVGALGSESYQIAIPIAGFMTPSGHELEGRGVHPRRLLQYDLKLSLEGRDSWIEEAKRRLQDLSSKKSRVSN